MNIWILTAIFAVLTPLRTLSTAPPQAGLDQKVQAYLDSQKNSWGNGHFPDSDGKLLYDLILKNKYTRAVEIGTGAGHSAIWIGWALSKTGGKLITVEINEARCREAEVRVREAGLSDFIDVRAADALKLLPELPAPFDFVFMDAPMVLARQFFDAAAPKIAVGGVYLTHGARIDGPVEYIQYLKSLRNFETSFDTGGGFCVTLKKSAR